MTRRLCSLAKSLLFLPLPPVPIFAIPTYPTAVASLTRASSQDQETCVSFGQRKRSTLAAPLCRENTIQVVRLRLVQLWKVHGGVCVLLPFLSSSFSLSVLDRRRQPCRTTRGRPGQLVACTAWDGWYFDTVEDIRLIDWRNRPGPRPARQPAATRDVLRAFVYLQARLAESRLRGTPVKGTKERTPPPPPNSSQHVPGAHPGRIRTVSAGDPQSHWQGRSRRCRRRP